MMPRKTDSTVAGFTLLEVMIALTVFAIGAGGMLVALGNHLRNVSFLEDQAKAVRIAARELDELRTLEEYDEEEVTGAEGRYAWVARMHTEDVGDWPEIDTIEEDSGMTIAQLDVVVQWGDVDGGELTHRVHLEAVHAVGVDEEDTEDIEE